MTRTHKLLLTLITGLYILLYFGLSLASDFPIPYGEGLQDERAASVATGSQVYYPSGTYYFTETDLSVPSRSVLTTSL